MDNKGRGGKEGEKSEGAREGPGGLCNRNGGTVVVVDDTAVAEVVLFLKMGKSCRKMDTVVWYREIRFRTLWRGKTAGHLPPSP